MDKYIELAIKEAKKAQKQGDVPVGAIIVKNNKVIAKAYNKKEKNKDATEHAEILAIRKACKKLKTWHLEECELYVTLEPCMMCCGAIIQSRINKIYYCAKSDKFGYVESISQVFENSNNHKPEVIKYIESIECIEMLKNFFKNKRNK